ncbi:ribosomal protein L29 [Anopheles sinensis]|uniref:Ribosomal protein L29 n=1 Tax=Anopheles sinensis TaxID=74873 RepID=A0A084WTI7_ANOSI|nr:ribosomal protein L29 [Anopheles sinensis]
MDSMHSRGSPLVRKTKWTKPGGSTQSNREPDRPNRIKADRASIGRSQKEEEEENEVKKCDGDGDPRTRARETEILV